MNQSQPTYPVSVTFLEDNDVWVFNNEEDLACSLEWFDSRDPKENAIVKDKNEKLVTVVVEKLEIKLCHLS